MNAMPYKRHRHKVKIKIICLQEKATNRSPLFFDLTADETDDNLMITFQSVLEEADITVTDKNGNVVATEFKTSIYECLPRDFEQTARNESGKEGSFLQRLRI